MSTIVMRVLAECKIGPKVADSRRVLGNIRIVVRCFRVWQIIASTVRELRQVPVSFDELHDRGVIGILMRDMSTGEVFVANEERHARSVSEVVDRLSITRIVVPPPFIEAI